MGRNNKVLTIDVGGDNLKMAEFSFVPGGGIVLTGFAFRRFDAKNESEDAPTFEQVYHEMLAENGFTARNVRLSLAAQNSFQRLSKLPPMLGNRASISKVVEYEARQTVPYSMSEVEWGYQLIHHQWVENTTETGEDGAVSEVAVEHSEYEALFVAMKTEEITPYTDVIEASGRKVLSVDIAPVALFNAAKAAQQVGNDECVLLINIGGTVSSLMISDHNRAFMRSIPIGGDSITVQIAKEFGISNEEAEELKLRHGFVALGGAYEDPESALAATISKVARTIMTRLHGEVSRSINVWRAQHGGGQPTRVLLSGGGSTMLYVTDFFQEKLRIPVGYLNTFGAISIAPTVNKEVLQPIAPMFQELIGMSLRSVTRCPIDISLLPRAISEQRDLNHKKPYFFASAIGIVICLAVFTFSMSRLSAFEKTRGDLAENKLKSVENVDREVSELNNKRNSEKGELEKYWKILDERNKGVAVMKELQRVTPKGMWYVVIEGVADKKQPENANGASADIAMGGGEEDSQSTAQDATDNRKFAVYSFPIAGKAGAARGREAAGDIKFIRLVGYTVQMDELDARKTDPRDRDKDDGRTLNRLKANLKKSEIFTDKVEYGENKPAEGENFRRFEIFLELKTPIKK